MLASRPPIIYLNSSSCSNISVDFPNETQCYTSLATIYLGLILGVFGLIVNFHMIWIYGFSRKLKSCSEQLLFTYGILDFVSCAITTVVNVLLLKISGTVACVSYMLLYMMMTRVALYLFTFGAVGRYFMICVRQDERGDTKFEQAI